MCTFCALKCPRIDLKFRSDAQPLRTKVHFQVVHKACIQGCVQNTTPPASSNIVPALSADCDILYQTNSQRYMCIMHTVVYVCRLNFPPFNSSKIGAAMAAPVAPVVPALYIQVVIVTVHL